MTPRSILSCLALFATITVPAAELRFAAASVDITPDEPVALDGQRRVRIARNAETPISTTVLALESREGVSVLDQAVIVSCDLVAIRSGITDQVRAKVRAHLADLDVDKIVLAATHTAPVTLGGRYTLPATGITQPAAYADWMTTRVADAVVRAWRNRAPGRIGWGQG